MADETSGGFFPGLQSPATSYTASTSTISETLPHPRDHPLKKGGSKESSFIRFVDQSLLKIQRRYAKRGDAELDVEQKGGDGSGHGYRSFAEAAGDIEKVVDLVWVSGTRMYSFPTV